jgi:hypothetical protein
MVLSVQEASGVVDAGRVMLHLFGRLPRLTFGVTHKVRLELPFTGTVRVRVIPTAVDTAASHHHLSLWPQSLPNSRQRCSHAAPSTASGERVTAKLPHPRTFFLLFHILNYFFQLFLPTTTHDTRPPIALAAPSRRHHRARPYQRQCMVFGPQVSIIFMFPFSFYLLAIFN